MFYAITLKIFDVTSNQEMRAALWRATYPYIHDIEWYQPSSDSGYQPHTLWGAGEVHLRHGQREHEVNLVEFLTLVVTAVQAVVGPQGIFCEVNYQVWVLHGIYPFPPTGQRAPDAGPD